MYREKIRQKYLELLRKTNSSILKDLVRVTTDQYDFDDKPIMTFDVSKEWRFNEFFANDQIQNEDTKSLIKK